MTVIGYARVSTARQDEAAQVQALTDAGCSQVFAERISTMVPSEKREQLQAALETLAEGDELVVAKLDRLGRTQVEVINRLNDLQQRGVHVRTLDGLINTQALGKMAPLVVGLLTGLAEVERSLIQERTRESIAYRRATGGDLGGRRRSYSEDQASLVRELAEAGRSRRKIQAATGLSQGTIDRILKTTATVDVVIADQQEVVA
jgi:DNA invertase Pin-like site-specific DNA recombinase